MYRVDIDLFDVTDFLEILIALFLVKDNTSHYKFRRLSRLANDSELGKEFRAIFVLYCIGRLYSYIGYIEI